MHMRLIGPALALAVATGCGSSGDCLSELAKIDELLAKGVTMTPEQRTKVNELRARAASLKDAGKEQECGTATNAALKILQQAEDAELMNKSDG